MDHDIAQSKGWENPASIKTELTRIGSKSVVKATVVVGGMTITSYSDEIQDSVMDMMADFKHQAVERALHLVPHS